MLGLTVRWSLAEAPAGVEEELAAYVAESSYDRFTGMDGLRFKTWRMVPGAWFEVQGERIKLLDAEVVEADGQPGEVLDDQLLIACGESALQPLLVQRAGKGAMSADELLRGFGIPRGTILP